MSKHTFVCINTSGQKVIVEVGYDRPLETFFTNIWDSDAAMIYTSLSEPAGTKDSDWLFTTLATHSVAIPNALNSQLAAEAMLGGSNTFTDHGEYRLSGVEETLLKAGFRQIMPDCLPPPEFALWAWYGADENKYPEYVQAFSANCHIAFPKNLGCNDQFESALGNPENEKTPEALQELATLILVGLNNMLNIGSGEKLCDALQREMGFAPCRSGFAELNIECFVEVKGEASDPQDQGVQGFYMVRMQLARPVYMEALTQAEQSEITTAVLDSFHEHNGIEVLDDFTIRVFLSNGIEVVQQEDTEDTGLVVHSDHQGQVSEEDLPFAAERNENSIPAAT